MCRERGRGGERGLVYRLGRESKGLEEPESEAGEEMRDVVKGRMAKKAGEIA